MGFRFMHHRFGTKLSRDDPPEQVGDLGAFAFHEDADAEDTADGVTPARPWTKNPRDHPIKGKTDESCKIIARVQPRTTRDMAGLISMCDALSPIRQRSKGIDYLASLAESRTSQSRMTAPPSYCTLKLPRGFFPFGAQPTARMSPLGEKAMHFPSVSTQPRPRVPPPFKESAAQVDSDFLADWSGRWADAGSRWIVAPTA
jgi:hypothetical protein